MGEVPLGEHPQILRYPGEKGEEGALFGIFVDPTKCKGCAECVEVCDALDYHALKMVVKDNSTLPRYRAAFDRYLRFLYFFYDHHSDPESYFWNARKILGSEDKLETRTAFVRLMSGAGDLLHGDGQLRDELQARHERLTSAIRRNRFSSAPEAQLFRVRSTLQEMDATPPKADEEAD